MVRFRFAALILLFTSTFAQFEEPSEVGFDDLSITENSKIVIIERNDSLFCFYRYSSALRARVSIDLGSTWTEPNTLSGVLTSSNRNFDVSLTEQGQILISTIRFPPSLKMFTYDFQSNTIYDVGNQTTISGISELEHLQINNENYLISAKGPDGNLFYLISSDKGVSWSNKLVFPNISTSNKPLHITKNSDKLFAAYLSENSIRIITSNHNGINWSTETEVFQSDMDITNVMIEEFQNSLYILFEQKEYVDLINDYQHDIYYITSEDGGNTWSSKNQFTTYLGNDFLSEILNSKKRLMLSFISDRPKSGIFKLYSADLLFSDDTAPPIIYHFKNPSIVEYNNKFKVQAFVNDKTNISSVTVSYFGVEYVLLDDGSGVDSIAGDNIYSLQLTAEPIGYDETLVKAININNVYMPISNYGALADVNYIGRLEDLHLKVDNSIGKSSKLESTISLVTGASSYGPSAKFENTEFLFSAGFILSGYANNQLFANGVARSISLEDYIPGVVGSYPEDSKNLIYEVHGDSPPFGVEWLKWKDAVEQGAYFYDGDGNGIYDPIDHNGNGVWDLNEDRPDLLYDATFFTVFNDGKPNSQRRFNNIDPLGIEIRQTIFASARNTPLSNTVFVRYSLKNTGIIADTLKDVIFTMWQDPDIGEYHYLDLCGVDTTLLSSFAYKNIEYDPLFDVPPAVFFTLVQGPKTYTGITGDKAVNRKGPILGESEYPAFKNMGLYSAIFTAAINTNFPNLAPRTSIEARNYALGNFANGNEMDPCTFEFADVNGINCVDINPLFWLSGNPLTNYGWVGNTPSEVKTFLNIGKFDLPVNNATDIMVAYTIDKGIRGTVSSGAMNSIIEARKRVSYIHDEYARNFSTLVGVENEEDYMINNFSLSQNYPNPFNPITTILFTIPNLLQNGNAQLETKLIIYDVLGREVKILINEVKSPGTYEVKFDASQFASGVYLYRLTNGSFSQTKKMMLIK